MSGKERNCLPLGSSPLSIMLLGKIKKPGSGPKVELKAKQGYRRFTVEAVARGRHRKQHAIRNTQSPAENCPSLRSFQTLTSRR